VTTTNDGFTKEEREAMKQRAAELRAEAKRAKTEEKAAADAQDCLDAIAGMVDAERAIAERIHSLIAEHAPGLAPKTWYGMPAYAGGDGKAVVFFQPAAKFGARYSTLGFQDTALLDDGTFWPTAFAITAIDDATETRIAELLRRAVGD
jgi:uncharacterized protein YdhG (YjbR/CyaY superfamily)